MSDRTDSRDKIEKIEHGKPFSGSLFSCNLCDYQCLNLDDMSRHADSHDRRKEERRKDSISPSYYKGRDVMDIINRYDLSFCLGNILCYILRAKEKNGVEDLKKARWYLDEEIRLEEEKLKLKGENE